MSTANPRSKDAILVEVTVIVWRDGSALEKRMMSPYEGFSGNGDLDFSDRNTPAIIVFRLNAPEGIHFPDACIRFTKANGNPTSQNSKNIFDSIAVSDDRTTLVVSDRNPPGSKAWDYTLFVEDDGQTIEIDPRIVNQ